MPTAVVAVGGNSLITEKGKESVPDQFRAIRSTSGHISGMIAKGWDVVVTHGNGPQVGYILLRSELAKKHMGLHDVPLDSCVADTQGAIGYMFQQALKNEFVQRGIDKNAVTVITRCRVDKRDPAFENPSKPIGPFMDEDEAQKHEQEDGWDVVEDAGRGYRRVVPSPMPEEILEEESIRTLVDRGDTVIAVGGGGIPVYESEDGRIEGIEAVIDKDAASGILANKIGADLLLISTAVENVCLHFGEPEEKKLNRITVSEAGQYLEEGHFAPGSMKPKLEAVIKFLERGGTRAVITSPARIPEAVEGEAGTEIVP